MSKQNIQERRATIGALLKKIREDSGLTKYKVCKDGNFRLETLDAIEKGEGYNIDALLKYLQGAGITMFFEYNPIDIAFSLFENTVIHKLIPRMKIPFICVNGVWQSDGEHIEIIDEIPKGCNLAKLMREAGDFFAKENLNR